MLTAWHHGARSVRQPRYWQAAEDRAAEYRIIPSSDTLLASLRTLRSIDDSVTENQIDNCTIAGVTSAKRLVAEWRHIAINTRNQCCRRACDARSLAVDWDA